MIFTPLSEMTSQAAKKSHATTIVSDSSPIDRTLSSSSPAVGTQRSSTTSAHKTPTKQSMSHKHAPQVLSLHSISTARAVRDEALTYRRCLNVKHKGRNCLYNPWCTAAVFQDMNEGIWREPIDLSIWLGAAAGSQYRSRAPAFTCRQPAPEGRGQQRSADKDAVLGVYTRPAGLTNLGATCYLNVLVQSFAFNMCLGSAILAIDTSSGNEHGAAPASQAPVSSREPLQEQAATVTGSLSPASSSLPNPDVRTVIRSLQEALGMLMYSPKSTYSLERFVDLLQIARNVQQDPNEFSKLFFALIESWNNSSDATARGGDDEYGSNSNSNSSSSSGRSTKTIRELIVGRERSVITCLECGLQGGREAEFQGVELGIEGLTSVAQALGHYYAEEPLTGSNKYLCGHCDRLCDATRRVIPTSVPDVLILQLMRNIYDKTTFKKKKLSHEVSFSKRLQLAGQDYMLVCVLYHKGHSALGGHYVAEAIDWTSGKWWYLDDEAVSEAVGMEGFLRDCAKEGEGEEIQPKGEVGRMRKGSDKSSGDVIDIELESDKEEAGDGGNKAPTKRSSFSKDGSKQLTLKCCGNIAASSNPARKSKEVSSKSRSEAGMTDSKRKKEAYMFFYVKSSVFEDCRSSVCISLPDHVKASLATASLEAEKHCAYLQTETERLQEMVSSRRSLVAAIGAEAACSSSSDPHHLVPTSWLRQWSTGLPDPCASSDMVDFYKTFLACSAGRDSEQGAVAVGEGAVPTISSKSEKESGKAVHEVSASSSGSDTEVDEAAAATKEEGAPPPEDATRSHVVEADEDGAGAEVQPTEFFESPIDISSTLCPHGKGKIHPLNMRNFKCISDTAYCQIISVAEVVPGVDLSPSGAICDECCNEFLREVSKLSEELKRDESITELCGRIAHNSAYHFASPTAGRHVYRLSREWFSAFKKATEAKRRRFDLWLQLLNTSNTPSVDSGKLPDWSTKSEVLLLSDINSSLLCEHGNIRDDFRRVSIPILEEEWFCLQGDYFPTASSVVEDAVVCEQCQSATVQTKETKRAMIDERSKEKNDRPLSDLRNRKQPHPPSIVSLVNAISSQDQSSALKRQLKSMSSSTTRFYLVSKSWLESWRDYLDHLESPRPPPFDCASSFGCDHGRCLIPRHLRDPDAFLARSVHDAISEAKDDSNLLVDADGIPKGELISEEQWLSLASCGHIKGKHQLIDPGTSAESGDEKGKEIECFDNMQLHLDVRIPTVVTMLSHHGDGGKGGGDLLWSWSDVHCEECAAVLAEKQLQKRKDYENKPIKIIRLRAGEALPPNALSGEARTASGRPVRSRRNASTEVRASSSDALGLLRLKIFERLGDAVPVLQTLYHNGELLADNTKNLGQLGILAGDTLYLSVGDSDSTEDHYLESIGILDEIEDASRTKSEFYASAVDAAEKKSEGGFHGSILQGPRRNITTATESAPASTSRVDGLQSPEPTAFSIGSASSASLVISLDESDDETPNASRKRPIVPPSPPVARVQESDADKMAVIVEKAVEMGFDADASRCAYLTLGGEGRACLDAVVDLLMSPSPSLSSLPEETKERKRTRRL